MRLPVENTVITSHFGRRILNGKEEDHKGVDFISRERSSVFAILDGRCSYDMDNYQEALRWIDRKHSIGNFCIIDCFIGKEMFHVRYCHLKDNLVYVGKEIKEGDYIGEYADVGYSFGAHLHLDCFQENWKVVNIEEVLKNVALVS